QFSECGNCGPGLREEVSSRPRPDRRALWRLGPGNRRLVHHCGRGGRCAVLVPERYAGAWAPDVLSASVAVAATACQYSQSGHLSAVSGFNSLHEFAGDRNTGRGAGPGSAGKHRTAANQLEPDDYALSKLEPASGTW